MFLHFQWLKKNLTQIIRMLYFILVPDALISIFFYSMYIVQHVHKIKYKWLEGPTQRTFINEICGRILRPSHIHYTVYRTHKTVKL
jgi:hypothetical protein